MLSKYKWQTGYVLGVMIEQTTTNFRLGEAGSQIEFSVGNSSIFFRHSIAIGASFWLSTLAILKALIPTHYHIKGDQDFVL